MKKYLIVSVVLFGFLVAGLVYAQTEGDPVSDLIKRLETQIKDLQAQIESLRKAQDAVRKARGEIQGTLTLIRQLREGMSGDDVMTLQAILAADIDVYPQGLLTGFYGRLTADAVRRFQKKHGFEQVGQVGPKTLHKLKEKLREIPLSLETDSATSTEKRPCAIIPPGHLIAPGWLRKQDGIRPLVRACQVLPPGIAKKLQGATTTPPAGDLTAPIISGVNATSTTENSTHIVWGTNELATSKVWYGTSTPLAITSDTLQAGSGSFVTSHDVLISSLTASTTHYYLIVSADAAGNAATSSQASLQTQ